MGFIGFFITFKCLSWGNFWHILTRKASKTRMPLYDSERVSSLPSTGKEFIEVMLLWSNINNFKFGKMSSASTLSN